MAARDVIVEPTDHGRPRRPHDTPAGLLPLVVGALGIVYGDLGTSPLYSIREAFEGASHRLAVDEVNVLGAVSIIVWTLVIIIAVKYVLLVLRADQQGEGGILVLTALVSPHDPNARGRRLRTPTLVLLGLFGTALLFGDGMITPAISVLSAVEGLEVVQPGLDSVVVPASVAILVALFAIQRFGTGRVGRVFGPVMVIWFATMGVLGAISVARAPGGVAGGQPRPRRALLHDQHDEGLPVDGLPVPRRDGWRGALRRHGALRSAADPRRLVHGRHARRCC